MSAQGAAFANGGGGGGAKKAVHVKWAGKTIALGTFPSAEADEKCARAKALTRAWRSTMRPKPSREWVMLELERLQVRVVSGRLGRKGGEEEEEDEGDPAKKKMSQDPRLAAAEAAVRRDSLLSGRRDSLSGLRRDSITASLLSAADIARGTGVDRNNSMGWTQTDIDSMMQRRNSSLGLSFLGDGLDDPKRRNSALGGSNLDPSMPPHRPLVGGGAAAAYEAARADHYANMSSQKGNEGPQRRASGLGLGSLGSGSSMPQMGLSVNPNQHYEMLKLHHMNLLNEIQETTLMMNLYQQQQLQQQQQQLQGQGGDGPGSGSSNDPQMSLLLQQQQQSSGGGGLDFGGGIGGMGQQRGSPMGLGGPATGASNQMQALLRQQQMLQGGGGLDGGMQQRRLSNMQQQQQQQLMAGAKEQEALQDRLQHLKEDIARRQKEAEELEAKAKKRDEPESGTKRKSDKDEPESSKKAKSSGDDAEDKSDEDDDEENETEEAEV